MCRKMFIVYIKPSLFFFAVSSSFFFPPKTQIISNIKKSSPWHKGLFLKLTNLSEQKKKKKLSWVRRKRLMGRTGTEIPVTLSVS